MLNNYITKDDYNRFCKDLKNEVRTQKRRYYSNYIINSGNKSKATWELVRGLTGGKRRGCSGVNDIETDNVGASQAETLDYINEYLINICGNSVADASGDVGTIGVRSGCVFLFPTSASEIYNVIMALKNTYSVGHDEISVAMLKRCAYQLSRPLAYLINSAFGLGAFPDDLKKAIVKLIHKKGEKSDINNYRPISLLSNVSKVFERVIYVRLYTYLKKNNIFTEMQNGYIGGRSVNRAIYQLVSRVLGGVGSDEDTMGIFMDLSRAFDSISYSKLYYKLSAIGVRGNGLNLIKSYLTNRKQRIMSIDERTGECIYSGWSVIQRGVPQGSILGPLLFLVYINDLPNVSVHQPVLFADDSSVIVSAKESLENEVRSTLETYESWFRNNDLKLNVKKTNLMSFGYFRQEPKVIKYKGDELTTVDHVRFLGVTLDCQLNWKNHIDNLSSKISSFSYALRVLASSVDIGAALCSYYAYVHSRIRYGVVFWGVSVGAPRVFRLQKMCLRAMFNMKKTESCKGVFAANNILTLPSIYIYECAVFVRENYELFGDQELSHNYVTRGASSGYLLPPQTTKTLINRNVTTQIVKIYNHLPSDLKSRPLGQFKGILRSCLARRVFYSVADFFNEVFVLV